jgi:glycosyltransferase involved in cell wall biosynthesis
MRIAQISPLFESVPPRLYGGTERIVHYLTEELVRQGHAVTLFASGDSSTSAELVPGCARALRFQGAIDPIAHHILMLEKAFQRCHDFDVVHSHLEYLPYPLARRHPHLPVISTLHGRLDLPDLVPLYQEFRDMPVVSISDSQRSPLPWINWHGTVHHGLPSGLYSFHADPGRYLAFLGRVSPEKGVERAIGIAVRAGIPLKLAAKVDNQDREYFLSRVQPLLDHPLVEFIGEIGEDRKGEFLGNALALMFTIDWPEPFGLVMIEALACGTPIIAWNRGSVPEVMEDGVTGYIVRDEDEAMAALARVPGLDRASCRRHFQERFTAERMASDYLDVYRRAVADRASAHGRDHGGIAARQRQVLHHGQLLPGRKTKPGAQAGRNLRRLR